MVLTHENFATSSVSQKQSNGNASWVYYIYPSLALVHTNVDDGILYIHIRGAFSVARFDLQGNAKAFMRGTSDRTGSTFYFVYVK